MCSCCYIALLPRYALCVCAQSLGKNEKFTMRSLMECGRVAINLLFSLSPFIFIYIFSRTNYRAEKLCRESRERIIIRGFDNISRGGNIFFCVQDFVPFPYCTFSDVRWAVLGSIYNLFSSYSLGCTCAISGESVCSTRHTFSRLAESRPEVMLK